jgi:exosortase
MRSATPTAPAGSFAGIALPRSIMPLAARLAVPVALLVFIYHRTAATLWSTWMTNDNYSHGPLVPLAALALAWMRRDRLAAVVQREDGRGLVVVGLACALQVLGIRSDVFAFQGYSLLLMIAGLVWTACGLAWLRVLAFPIGYLVFMLTFPPIVMNTLSFALKEVTVRLSMRVGEALGATVQRSGMTLYLTGGEMRMENPCSGLRSLLALLATGAVFADLQPGSWWRRAVLFVSAVPIAMAGNSLRITLLILVGHYVGVKEATGRFHDWSGYLIYVVALGGLLAVRALLTPRKVRVAT